MLTLLERKLVKRFYAHKPGARLLALLRVGSHLFDLNTAQSDKDYRAVYLPSVEELKTQKLGLDTKSKKKLWNHGSWSKQFQYKTNEKKNQKNSKHDVDCNFCSLDEYLRLLGEGDFNMLELLYAPKSKVLVSSPEFEELRLRRHMFTPVSLKSFLGFARGEVRLAAYDENTYTKYVEWLAFLKELPPSQKLKWHWEKLEKWNEELRLGHLVTVRANQHTEQTFPAFRLANRLWLSTTKVQNLVDEAEAMLKGISYRKQDQHNSEGKYQTKTLSHALRLLYEAEDLMAYNELRFPFSPEKHAMLKRVKAGLVHRDELLPLVEEKLAQVELNEDLRRMDMETYEKKMRALQDWGKYYFQAKKQKALLNEMAFGKKEMTWFEKAMRFS